MDDRYAIFTLLISKINRCIQKIKSEEMSEFGLKGTHVSCLYYLYKENGNLTAKELSVRCGEDKGAISRTIDFLETNGYLTCESKTEKRYRSPLFLTEKGKDIGEYISLKIDTYLSLASIGIKKEERLSLYKNLNLIAENLQNICEKY